MNQLRLMIQTVPRLEIPTLVPCSLPTLSHLSTPLWRSASVGQLQTPTCQISKEPVKRNHIAGLGQPIHLAPTQDSFCYYAQDTKLQGKKLCEGKTLSSTLSSGG